MKKTNGKPKKVTLNQETVSILSQGQLASVVGGRAPGSGSGSNSGVLSDKCPKKTVQGESYSCLHACW